MDIAYYISDLLGQQGELSVPNLGYFVQIRMPSYYDNEAKKFYPPHFSVQFDPQEIDDDDSLSAYIASLKKISQASAKYFIEKYISNLKSQAVIEDVAFANLGKFSSNGIKLSFQPGIKTDSPAFFALHPVAAYHTDEESLATEPVVQDEFAPAPFIAPEYVPETETVAEPENEEPFEFTPSPFPDVIYPANTEAEFQTTPEYASVEDAPVRSIGAWTIILIVLTVLAIAFVALYKFKPILFKNWFSLHKNPYIAAQPIVPPAVKHADSTMALNTAANLSATDTAAKTELKNDSLKPEVTIPVTQSAASSGASAVKNPAKTVVTPASKTIADKPEKIPAKATAVPTAKTSSPAASSAKMPDKIAKGSWVIYGGAFPVRAWADKAISNYKSMGYEQARLLTTDVKKGNNYKIILGAYKTRAEAVDASKELLLTHKISISVEQL
jgi:hypothetical protein